MTAVRAFSCGQSAEDQDLNEFLREDAFRLQTLHVVQVVVAFFREELVGYVALLSDSVRLKSTEKKKLAMAHDDHPLIPALKIARLAVSEAFRKTHRGLGEVLVGYALSVALVISEQVGCRLVTLDAYPKSIAFYEKLGFQPNRAKEYEANTHPSMRLDIHAQALPAWYAALLKASSRTDRPETGSA